ncbi:MAG: phosphoadenosine phosphosulfate reductase family protein [Gammaproteobacteria bacterium]|nr:phosphoadenosine phosphosulfate reductase family protein [Gammaproteobacteria bacterium]
MESGHSDSEVATVELKRTRHVLGLSGGKDSAALAIYLKEQGRDDDIEYFFCDTGAELREVYDYLDRLEDYLGKPIERLSSGRDFDHHLKRFNNYLPAPHARWCTRVMKLEPLEAFIGDDPCVSYIGIRADEKRDGYISHKPNIKPAYPFIDDGIVKSDVFRILQESVGVPEYYRWRSRSGCYFCFFQRKDEWLGLADNHPDLFERAKSYEKVDSETGKLFTWVRGMTLEDIRAQRSEIERAAGKSEHRARTGWQQRILDDGPDDPACVICTL